MCTSLVSQRMWSSLLSLCRNMVHYTMSLISCHQVYSWLFSSEVLRVRLVKWGCNLCRVPRGSVERFVHCSPVEEVHWMAPISQSWSQNFLTKLSSALLSCGGGVVVFFVIQAYNQNVRGLIFEKHWTPPVEAPVELCNMLICTLVLDGCLELLCHISEMFFKG